jgi:seryl-tRNA(Sec) selenium transferase
VIVDAAGEIYPLERMTWLPQSGADLVCFGAKYLGSANSTGIVCGKAGAVRATALNGFISFESQDNRALGRGFKLDRQEIVGTTAALHEWLHTDHEERLQEAAARIDTLIQAVEGLPHITARNVWEEEGGPWMRLRIQLDAGLGKTAQQVAHTLQSSSPPIWVRVTGEDLFVEVHTLREGETEVLAQRLRAVLGD